MDLFSAALERLVLLGFGALILGTAGVFTSAFGRYPAALLLFGALFAGYVWMLSRTKRFSTGLSMGQQSLVERSGILLTRRRELPWKEVKRVQLCLMEDEEDESPMARHLAFKLLPRSGRPFLLPFGRGLLPFAFKGRLRRLKAAIPRQRWAGEARKLLDKEKHP